MKRFLAAALILATGCARTQEFKTYKDPGGDFSLTIPADWVPEADPDRKPASVTSFLTKKTIYDEGQPLGPVLHVTKFYRNRSSHPGTNEDFKAYQENILFPTDILFGASVDLLPAHKRSDLTKNVRDTRISGIPAKTYQKSFEYTTAPMHGNKKFSVKLEDIVIQTPEAYYVLEYRATKELFDKYYFAFEKASETFRLLTSKQG